MAVYTEDPSTLGASAQWRRVEAHNAEHWDRNINGDALHYWATHSGGGGIALRSQDSNDLEPKGILVSARKSSMEEWEV